MELFLQKEAFCGKLPEATRVHVSLSPHSKTAPQGLHGPSRVPGARFEEHQSTPIPNTHSSETTGVTLEVSLYFPLVHHLQFYSFFLLSPLPEELETVDTEGLKIFEDCSLRSPFIECLLPTKHCFRGFHIHHFNSYKNLSRSMSSSHLPDEETEAQRNKCLLKSAELLTGAPVSKACVLPPTTALLSFFV